MLKTTSRENKQYAGLPRKKGKQAEEARKAGRARYKKNPAKYKKAANANYKKNRVAILKKQAKRRAQPKGLLR